MAKQISELTNKATPVGTDEIAIQETGGSTTKKATLANVLAGGVGKIVAGADTSAGDQAAMGYTATEGAIITGQGSSNDVTIKNDADQSVAYVQTGTQNLTLSAGIHIGGTGSANLLDDYEEGTWTPVLSDGTNNATMTAATVGAYTKVGQDVTIYSYVVTSSLGSVSGAIRVTGLPFTVASSPNGGYTGFSVGYAGGLAITAGHSVSAYPVVSTTFLYLWVWDATTGTTQMQGSEWTADGEAMIGGSYKV